MYERFCEPKTLPYCERAAHTLEGLLVEFSHGPVVFYQTSFLCDTREYAADVPVELARGLVDPPREVNQTCWTEPSTYSAGIGARQLLRVP